jgi:hypothetical protein
MDEGAYQALSRTNAGEKIMTMKYIVAVALIAPFLTVSSLAQEHVYQGSPKSNVAPTTRQISSGGDIYAKGVKAKKSNAYRSGPQTVVPRGN